MIKIHKLDLVVALYIFGVMTAELMGSKTFPLISHFNASVAIFVVPMLFTMINSVTEVYGRARARSIVYSGFIVISLLILYMWLATSLPSSYRFKQNEQSYDTIFHSALRISLASLTAFAISELLDVAIFVRIREALKGKALWFRTNLTSFTAQFMDVLVFIFLAFYSVSLSFGANINFLFSLIIPYWLIRCGLTIIETPLVYVGVWWLKEDRNDHNTY
ncbi:MAG TPA: queuosine precursor transporter [Candidatus Saccharimonadales bacterium]|nr:queuosine precursor transporter [Candidatus Saccharimonadales bacterium]